MRNNLYQEAYHIFYKELKLLLDFYTINMEAFKKVKTNNERILKLSISRY